MASLVYNSCVEDVARGNIDFDTDTFYVMLVGAGYTENKATHAKRSDVTSEIAASGGYVAGGFEVTVTVTRDNDNNRVVVELGGISIPDATITAAKAVYYKRRGGAASADEVVAVNDFGGNVASTAAAWSLAPSTITFQN